jgi:hypothetical protein
MAHLSYIIVTINPLPKRFCTLMGRSISRIDLTLYLLYEVRGGFFLLLDPPAKIQLKHVVLGSNIFDLALKTRCPQNGGGGLMLLLVCSQWGGPNQC